jgi:hypothetical protein
MSLLPPFLQCNVRVVEYEAVAVFQLARAQGKRREMNEQGAVELLVGWIALLLFADTGRVEEAPGGSVYYDVCCILGVSSLTETFGPIGRPID